ncbi:hypothetical protein ACFQV8_21995 [Pseudonocardia benzenivorans]
MTAWTPKALSWLVFVSLWLVIVYYPNGEAALYNWGYLAGCALVCGLAAWSLLHPTRCGCDAGRTRPPGRPPRPRTTR